MSETADRPDDWSDYWAFVARTRASLEPVSTQLYRGLERKCIHGGDRSL